MSTPPLAGTVSEINDRLEENPELINESCYKEGWLCKLTLQDPSAVSSLMDAKAYSVFLKEEEA